MAECRVEPGVMAEIDYMEGHEMEVLDPESEFEVALDPLTGLGTVHSMLVVQLFVVEAVQFGVELGAAAVAAAVAGVEVEAAVVAGSELGAAVVPGAEHEAGPVVGVESELDQKPEEGNLAWAVVDTVELLVDIDSNIDSSVGKDHIQDTADSTVGIAAGTVAVAVAVADTTVLHLAWQLVQLVVAQLNWLVGYLGWIQAGQKLVMSVLEKQVTHSELQSGFALQQQRLLWMCCPGQCPVVAPEIAHPNLGQLRV